MSDNLNTKINDFSDEERLSSVDVDIESQVDSKKEYKINESQIKIPLKGILKSSDDENNTREIMLIRMLELCSCLFYIVIMLPIGVGDLYFGVKKNACIKIFPDNIININLEIYLLVSGFLTFSLVCVFILITITFIRNENKNKNNCCLTWLCMGIIRLLSLFYIIWYILGAIIFWVYVYRIIDCNKEIIIYMFITLIIKLITVLAIIKKNVFHK